MSVHSRRALLLGALGGLAACKERSVPAPSSSSTALSSADPRGLPEGTLSAFGLTLPLGTMIVRRSGLSVVARVPASLERTVEYVRGRLAEGTLEATPTRVEVAKARFRDSPKQVGSLRMVLERALESTELTLRRNLDS